MNHLHPEVFVLERLPDLRPRDCGRQSSLGAHRILCTNGRRLSALLKMCARRFQTRKIRGRLKVSTATHVSVALLLATYVLVVSTEPHGIEPGCDVVLRQQISSEFPELSLHVLAIRSPGFNQSNPSTKIPRELSQPAGHRVVHHQSKRRAG